MTAHPPPALDLTADVALLTASLLDIESVSGNELTLADAVETALKNTPGVTDAVVVFAERAAYVSGSAQVSDLVEAVEAVGFTAEMSINQPGRNGGGILASKSIE